MGSSGSMMDVRKVGAGMMCRRHATLVCMLSIKASKRLSHAWLNENYLLLSRKVVSS